MDTSCLSGKPKPTSLVYRDIDGNNRIDTLEIAYDQELSGALDVSTLLLSSATGGLYERRVNTETGFFLTGFLLGNLAILKIQE